MPFIVSDPGNRLGLQSGTVSDHVVEMRDIMPSLLEAAGVPIPETVEGESIWRLASAGRDGEASRIGVPIFMESTPKGFSPIIGLPTERRNTSGSLKREGAVLRSG